MREATRNLLVNLAGALVVGLAVGLLMSVRIGGPPFWRPLPYNFLLAFVPYALAALLASRFTKKFANPTFARCVFIAVAGSLLSAPLFFLSEFEISSTPAEWAASEWAALLLFGGGVVLLYALAGFFVLAAVNGLAAVVGRPSYRSSSV